MPRPRNPENKGLPARWQHIHGAYYFQVPAGQEGEWGGRRKFRLGATLTEAYAEWAARTGAQASASSIGVLLDRYALEVVPGKAAKTRTENMRHIQSLRGVFGAMSLEAMAPQMIYQYVDRRGARTAAHREIEVLSHAFTKAVEWGYVERHPFKGQVRLEGEPARTRYVEDWEIVECLSLDSRRKKGSVLAIQAYIRLKMLTGLAQGDLLRLRLDEHLQADGIHVTRHKTAKKVGKQTIYEYAQVPERAEAVEQARRARPALSQFLFCTRDGAGYVNEENGEARGWRSMWQRFMDRVLAETKVTQRFTEHDLRAKVGSDAKSLDHARALLQHADMRTTHAIYRRKPERV